MGNTSMDRRIAERQREARRSIGRELREARLTANLSMRQVSAAAGLHHSHLPRIEAGERWPSQEALIALATVMGFDTSIRLFQSNGPRIRDRIQALMVEALLAVLHQRWTPRLEVAVYRPVRGVIDVVLSDRDTDDVVAGEGHSKLHAVEQQLRWAGEKADALASAQGWPWADTLADPRVGRLLLLRSCAAMHALVRTLPRTFEAAYPAASEHAVAALTGPETRWPGAAIVWVDVDGAGTRLLEGRPKALRR